MYNYKKILKIAQTAVKYDHDNKGYPVQDMLDRRSVRPYDTGPNLGNKQLNHIIIIYTINNIILYHK